MTDRPPRPSDAEPAIAAHGSGDVVASVVSMSARHPDGLDAAYLEWHVLDHLPEQHRLVGLRNGRRFVSTPACRAARAASIEPFDAVDHIVQYLFAEPVDAALDDFFPLGGALRAIGRMPMVLPRIQVGGWTLDHALAADRVLVGASVLPWRHARGAYVLIERIELTEEPDPGTLEAIDPDPEGVGNGTAALVEVDGVVGAWCWIGESPRHARLESTAELVLTFCYLDAPPVEVAAALVPVLDRRWADGRLIPVLAAPFESVVPGDWERHLP